MKRLFGADDSFSSLDDDDSEESDNAINLTKNFHAFGNQEAKY
jgi:hypothetical protein